MARPKVYNSHWKRVRKMSAVKERLIEEAKKRYGTICLPQDKESFSDCFTCEKSMLIFWFNTEDLSTHLLAERIDS
jgi:hypothetical protein